MAKTHKLEGEALVSRIKEVPSHSNNPPVSVCPAPNCMAVIVGKMGLQSHWGKNHREADITLLNEALEKLPQPKSASDNSSIVSDLSDGDSISSNSQRQSLLRRSTRIQDMLQQQQLNSIQEEDPIVEEASQEDEVRSRRRDYILVIIIIYSRYLRKIYLKLR